MKQARTIQTIACERCRMTFDVGRPNGHAPKTKGGELTRCAEPGCKRLFGHAKLKGNHKVTVWVPEEAAHD